MALVMALCQRIVVLVQEKIAEGTQCAPIPPSSKPTWEPRTMPMLEVECLTVRYGRLEAVREASFQVDAGQIVALIGSNGAGKSSSLKAVIGLARAASVASGWTATT